MSDRTCAVDGCEKPHNARGWCLMHYYRWKRHGTTDSPRPPVHERFLAKVAKTPGCWMWQGAIATQTGYGRFTWNGQKMSAHRAAYELFVSPIPECYTIDHMCHVVACVNPEHLQAVPQYVNSQNRKGAAANSKSGVRGVRKKDGRYVGTVVIRKRQHWVGTFATIQEAEVATIALRNRLMSNNLVDRRSA